MRVMVVRLVNRGGRADWRVTYTASGARRYIPATEPLGNVVLGLCSADGDKVVVMPAGFAFTYTLDNAEADNG